MAAVESPQDERQEGGVLLYGTQWRLQRLILPRELDARP